MEGKGLRFQAVLLATAEGGRVEAGNGRVVVREASAVTFIVVAATSFVNYRDIGGDSAAILEIDRQRDERDRLAALSVAEERAPYDARRKGSRK